jgi:hypothetical protein
MRVFTKALELTGQINAVLVKNGGRAADDGVSLPFLGSMVALAGDGNHVDIGSLYGASAIMAALMKKDQNLAGTVYCIDPYDAATRNLAVLPAPGIKGNVSATPEEFWKNVEEFDVKDRIKLIRKVSHPWPEELKDTVFASAYIDGDHKGESPWNDFENLRGRVTKYIGCDNYEEEYPDVVNAMWKAMDTEDWTLFYKNITFVALRRVLPSRAAGSNLLNMLQL